MLGGQGLPQTPDTVCASISRRIAQSGATGQTSGALSAQRQRLSLRCFAARSFTRPVCGAQFCQLSRSLSRRFSVRPSYHLPQPCSRAAVSLRGS